MFLKSNLTFQKLRSKFQLIWIGLIKTRLNEEELLHYIIFFKRILIFKSRNKLSDIPSRSKHPENIYKKSMKLSCRALDKSTKLSLKMIGNCIIQRYT